ncbi:integumentary mucin C.1-like [Physella acuta]|uniref:integumentary mucin C.1-like n=1 Tax=Physella acuta TaxID=109671 RepID=UPI0027DBD358|nr:integumentary mucin C.1-like [Physella acuta]
MMCSCPVSTFLLVLCVLIVGGYAATLNTTTTTTTTIKTPTIKTTTKAPTTRITTTTKARTTLKTILTKAPATTKTTIKKTPPTTKTTTKKTTVTTKTTTKLPTTSTKTTTKKATTAATTLSPSTTKSYTTFSATKTTNPENCEGLDNPDPDNPCAHCFCSNGRYVCEYHSCIAPSCVDDVTNPGECCPFCPNGDNCQVGGQIIPVSQTLIIPGYGTCSCVYPKDADIPHPVCVAVTTNTPTTTQTTTTTSGNCEGLDNPGLADPCAHCFCDNGRYVCEYHACQAPNCVDDVTNPGECCAYCPNGDNCQVGGQIIPVSQTLIIPGYGACSCVYPKDTDIPHPVCVAVTTSTPTTTQTTTTTPDNCEGIENPGLGDPCAYCNCYRGEYLCAHQSCPELTCESQRTEPGECCTQCV